MHAYARVVCITHGHVVFITRSLLVGGNRALVRHIDTIQEFTDVLVPYSTDTVDRGSFR